MPYDNSVKSEIDFAVDDAFYTFDKTIRFVVLLTDSQDIFKWRSWRYGERRLRDCLIACVKFRDDEVACGSEG